MATPLIDATEMYLKTIWELEEEGILPIRARLVERLHLSAPAVSETVTRLEHDGLVEIAMDRRLTLTPHGRELAVSVMRKHRLVERLLVDVIALAPEQLHVEACRWEHVISDRVEDRLVDLLADPATDPYGNPIPGHEPDEGRAALRTLAEAARDGDRAQVRRISEKLQSDVAVLAELFAAGIVPGADLRLTGGPKGVTVAGPSGSVELAKDQTALIYVAVGPPA